MGNFISGFLSVFIEGAYFIGQVIAIMLLVIVGFCIVGKFVFWVDKKILEQIEEGE
jgi:hypothetical protein